MTTQDYIRPTKKSPVFIAVCDWFGNIEEERYKDYEIKTDGYWCVGSTFGISFRGSVNRLHEWIQDNPTVVKDYPKCKFEIYLLDGTVTKDKSNQVKVYSISASKAKKLLLS